MVYTDKEQSVKYLHIYSDGKYAFMQLLDRNERAVSQDLKRFKRGRKCLKYKGFKLYAMSEKEK